MGDFGEIEERYSRAFWDDDGDEADLQEQEEPQWKFLIEENDLHKLQENTNRFLIIEGINITISDFVQQTILSNANQVAYVESEKVYLYYVPGINLFVCLSELSDFKKFNIISEKLFDIVKCAKEIICLSILHAVTHKGTSHEEKKLTCFMRGINSKLDTIPELEVPNFISGITASVCSWLRYNKSTFSCYIIYTDVSSIDPVLSKPILQLFTEIGIPHTNNNKQTNRRKAAMLEVEDNLSDEELIPAQKVLQIFENNWLNEKFSPDIMPHQSEMLELLLEQLSHMEENINSLPTNDFRYIAHQLELERIRYIVASYLRHRIEKIDNFTEFILIEEDKRTDKRLSDDEYKYAKAYSDSIQEHFKQIAFDHVPYNLLDKNKLIIRPNLLSNVFVKITSPDASIVIAAGDEEINLTSGSQHLISYQLIADLVLDGRVQLI